MTTNYRSSSAVTISLSGLASSSGLTVGRCSDAYSNATNKDDGVLPTLQFQTGSVAPTVNTVLEFWAFAQRADGVWPSPFTAAYTGSDGGFTVNSRDALFATAVLLGSYTFDTATSRIVDIRGRGLAQAFGDFVPQNVAFFVTHSSGQNLGSTSALVMNAGSQT